MRRAWLHGRRNLQERYLIQISGYILGLIMRLLTGFGTPRQWADAEIGAIWLRCTIDDQTDAVRGCLLVVDAPDYGTVLRLEVVLVTLSRRNSSTRC